VQASNLARCNCNIPLEQTRLQVIASNDHGILGNRQTIGSTVFVVK
jgi:hypothetical protein